jgi:DAK2 domain fusion protein YloV
LRETIDGVVFTEMLLCASAALQQNMQQINDLNVFPVPDGDTGTNMSMTMAAGAAELRRKSTNSVDEVAKIAANAFLRGARGNSGVILSLLFRGMSKALKGKDTASAYDFSQAMTEGVEAAYKAVMKPAEGTILTVSRMAAASAADFAETGTDIELMLSCALESAKEALADTVNQNPVLKKAGVIDAGGKGYATILEAMLLSLRGEVTPDSYDTGDTGGSEVSDQADFGDFDTGEITFAYDTVYIVRWTDGVKNLDPLREYLCSIGDCLVIGESDEEFKVHVHTNIPGDALTESQKYGTLEIAKIENMRTQHDELVAANAAAQAKAAEPERDFGTVVVCAGKGIEALFTELGVDAIVTGGQTMNPSTQDILKAVEATPARTVFVFPNNKNIIMAAEQCAPLTEKKVVVIPTKTVAQGISALLSLDTYTQTEAEIIESATAAIGNVHTALITYAARDSDFDGYEIKAGEYLGLLDGALLGSNSDISTLIERLADMLEQFEPEFITVYYGADVDFDDAEVVGAILTEKYPGAETSVIDGGQPVYYYMISAE